MSTTKFLSGSVFNLMGRGTLYSADESPYYLRENVADGDPSIPFKFAEIREDGWIKVDLNLVLDDDDGTNCGDFETFVGVVPKGWSASIGGGGTIGSSTDVHGGALALSCGVGFDQPGSGGVAKNITCRAGESLALNTWMKSLSGGGIARVEIRNQQTGHYLAKGGWQIARTDCQTETGTADYVNHIKTFTVEDYDTCQADVVTLRIRLYNDTLGSTVLFDDVYLSPGVNFFSIHGHNIEPRISVLWQYSATDTAGVAPAPYTLISSHAAAAPSFYGTTTTIYQRWIQFTFSGTPYAAPISIGELVLGQYQTLTTDAQHPAQASWAWDYVRPQVENVTQTGKRHVSNLTDHRQRTLRMPYFQKSDATFTQFREEIMDRCQDGALPLVIVPDDSKGDVLFGQIPGAFSDRQGSLTTAHGTELLVVECPFGLSGE